MSGLNLDASVDTLARDNEPWTMPACDNPDCPVGCPDSHCAPYHLLDEVRPAPKPCARCGNTGWIQRLPTTYETDSREEAALAWDMARYPCPECSK